MRCSEPSRQCAKRDTRTETPLCEGLLELHLADAWRQKIRAFESTRLQEIKFHGDGLPMG